MKGIYPRGNEVFRDFYTFSEIPSLGSGFLAADTEYNRKIRSCNFPDPLQNLLGES